jgi:hypothetical protein
MSYVLLELDTGNTVGFYPSEGAALATVADSIKRYGADSVETLGLAYNDPAGPVRRIADGPELAELAQRALRAKHAARAPRRSPAARRRGA